MSKRFGFALSSRFKYVFILAFIIQLSFTIFPSHYNPFVIEVNASEELSAPTGISYTVSDTTVTLKWKKVSGATGYTVMKYDPVAKRFTDFKKVNENSCTIKNLQPGKTYYFKVKAIQKTSWGAFESDCSKRVICEITEGTAGSKAPKAPDNIVVTDVTDNSAYIKWEASSGADSYTVFEFNNGKFSPIADVKINKIILKGLKSGKNYTYYIEAYKIDDSGRKVGSGYSDAVYICTKSKYYSKIRSDLPDFEKYGYTEVSCASIGDIVIGGDIQFQQIYSLKEFEKMVKKGQLPTDDYYAAIVDSGFTFLNNKREKLELGVNYISGEYIYVCKNGKKTYKICEYYIGTSDDQVFVLVSVEKI